MKVKLVQYEHFCTISSNQGVCAVAETSWFNLTAKVVNFVKLSFATYMHWVSLTTTNLTIEKSANYKRYFVVIEMFFSARGNQTRCKRDPLSFARSKAIIANSISMVYIHGTLSMRFSVLSNKVFCVELVL